MNETAIPFLLFTKKKVEKRRFNVFSANKIDKSHLSVQSVRRSSCRYLHGLRPGGSCGNSFFSSGGHCHGQNFMVFLQIVAKSLIKKLPERHGSNNVEHRQALTAFPFFYDLESEITLSKKQRFHRIFSMFG